VYCADKKKDGDDKKRHHHAGFVASVKSELAHLKGPRWTDRMDKGKAGLTLSVERHEVVLQVFTQDTTRTTHHCRAHYQQRPFNSVFKDRFPGVDRYALNEFLSSALASCDTDSERKTDAAVAQEREKLGKRRGYEGAIDEKDGDFKKRRPWFVCDFSCNWLSCLLLIIDRKHISIRPNRKRGLSDMEETDDDSSSQSISYFSE
jgi:hypothetical protein